MNVIKCKNGHFFDGDLYSTCPHCGEMAMPAAVAPVKAEKKSIWSRGRKERSVFVPTAGQTPSVAPSSNFESGNTPTDVLASQESRNISTPVPKKDYTLDFWENPSHTESVTDDLAKNTDNETGMNACIEEENDDMAINDMRDSDQLKEQSQQNTSMQQGKTSPLYEAVKKSSASSEGLTMSFFSSATNSNSTQSNPRCPAEPVVGWLVCVGGCHFGECFNIYAGKNSIGRSDENRIVVSDDNSISRVKHAFVVYEPKKRNFYLQPGDSSGLTYLNDNYITDSHILAAQDMVELGDSKFVFVPLCGETFSWEDHMPKGE